MQLTLPSRVDQAAEARRAIASTAQRAGLGVEAVADLKTIVTEAFTNAVEHAYGGREGRIDVCARADEGEVTVTVRDYGAGITPRPVARNGEARSSVRLGLLLIASLASSMQIRAASGGGTEIIASVSEASAARHPRMRGHQA